MVSTASNKLVLHSINVEIFLFLLVHGLAGVCQDQSDNTAATAMYLEASNNFVNGPVLGPVSSVKKYNNKALLEFNKKSCHKQI